MVLLRPADPPPFNSGSVFRTRIYNTRHQVTVGFDERSAGFVWFFSFLVWFSQVRKNYGNGKSLIILLDEPALSSFSNCEICPANHRTSGEPPVGTEVLPTITFRTFALAMAPFIARQWAFPADGAGVLPARPGCRMIVPQDGRGMRRAA